MTTRSCHRILLQKLGGWGHNEPPHAFFSFHDLCYFSWEWGQTDLLLLRFSYTGAVAPVTHWFCRTLGCFLCTYSHKQEWVRPERPVEPFGTAQPLLATSQCSNPAKESLGECSRYILSCFNLEPQLQLFPGRTQSSSTFVFFCYEGSCLTAISINKVYCHWTWWASGRRHIIKPAVTIFERPWKRNVTAGKR